MGFDNSSLYHVESNIEGERRSLFDLATWKNGLAFRKIDFSQDGVPVIKIAELNNGIGSTTTYTQGNYDEDVFLQRGDLLFSWSGNPKTSIDIYRFDLPCGWLNQHIFKVTPNEDLVRKDFFYHLMKFLKPYFTEIAINKQTTGLGHVTIADLKRLNVICPSDKIQRKIAAILQSIDDKIYTNNAINKNLEEQAQAIFKAWFVDFEPFGGEMPDDWRAGTAGEILEFYDSKRIPLSGSDREKMAKIYPYYGATSLMDYVEDYIFDGVYLLLGEDGTVVTEDGFPVLQYVDGKFWVNNHAHILTGRCGFSVEALYLLFSLTNIQHIVTGAVQPKISQTNLKKVEVIIPPETILRKFDDIIQPMFAIIRNQRAENLRLTELRDALLPRLMSGEIDVSTGT